MTGSGACGQCGAAAALRCGGCSAVHYCSKDHQRQHWTTHKDQCWPVTIAQHEGKGRYLVASRDLKEGQMVIKDAPVVLGPVADTLPICLGCHALIPSPAEDQDMPRCPGCHWPVCGMECAATDRHLAECGALASDTKGIGPPTAYMQTPRYDIILNLRCLLLRTSNPDEWEKIKGMESHVETRENDDDSYRKAAVTYFSKILDVDCDTETINHIHGAILTNAINTFGGKGQCLRGIYPSLYLMNHSCRPNITLRSDQNSTVYVRAAVAIKKGEPILFSYLPPTDPIWRRQHDLKTIYNFECECSRCKDHTELGTYYSSPRCVKCNEGFLEPYDGAGKPWSCPECSEKREQDDIAKETEEYATKLEGHGATVESATNLLNDIVNTFHVNHFVWLMAAQTVLRELKEMSEEAFSLRKDLWRRLIHLYQRLEPGATRRKGVSLYNGAVVEREAATLQLAKTGLSQPSPVFEEGLTRAVRMLDSAISILELEPPGSTELRWLEMARKEKKNIFDMIGAGEPEDDGGDVDGITG